MSWASRLPFAVSLVIIPLAIAFGTPGRQYELQAISTEKGLGCGRVVESVTVTTADLTETLKDFRARGFLVAAVARNNPDYEHLLAAVGRHELEGLVVSLPSQETVEAFSRLVTHLRLKSLSISVPILNASLARTIRKKLGQQLQFLSIVSRRATEEALAEISQLERLRCLGLGGELLTSDLSGLADATPQVVRVGPCTLKRSQMENIVRIGENRTYLDLRHALLMPAAAELIGEAKNLRGLAATRVSRHFMKSSLDLTRLDRLEQVELKGCYVQGLPKSGSLQTLELKGCSGLSASTIEATLAKAHNLELLALQLLELDRPLEIPNSGYPRLSRLEVIRTSLKSGNLGKLLAKAEALEHVSLVGVEVSGFVLESIANHRRLAVVDLTNSSVTDKVFGTLKTLDKLEDLRLAGTEISDDGLEKLTNWRNLRLLDVSNTQVAGKGVGTLERLRSLSLGGPFLRVSQLKQSLPKLEQLRELRLSGGKITDELLSCLSELPNLQRIVVSEAPLVTSEVAANLLSSGTKEIQFWYCSSIKKKVLEAERQAGQKIIVVSD